MSLNLLNSYDRNKQPKTRPPGSSSGVNQIQTIQIQWSYFDANEIRTRLRLLQAVPSVIQHPTST